MSTRHSATRFNHTFRLGFAVLFAAAAPAVTLSGEAAADLGGLMLAWRAFHSFPQERGTQEFSPDQQCFIAFAHSWSGAVRPERARELVTTDPHPPAEYRTNATLANSPDFQAAFSIASPSALVKTPRCVIW